MTAAAERRGPGRARLHRGHHRRPGPHQHRGGPAAPPDAVGDVHPIPSDPYPAELCQLLALRRVHRGHVVLVGHDLFVDRGRRLPDYLHIALRELLDDGHLHLGSELKGWAQWPVLATASGEQLHTKLEELRK